MVFRTQDSLNLELIWTEPKVSSLENYLHTRCLSDFGLLLTEYHRLSDLYNNRNLFLTVLGCLRYKIRVPAWSGFNESPLLDRRQLYDRSRAFSGVSFIEH